MDAVTYPQEGVARFVEDHFVPVKIMVDDHPELTKKYHAPWTPTALVVDRQDVERHREVGYLPPEDLLAHLNLALGRIAFDDKDYPKAVQHLQAVVDRYSASEVMPEALYYLGVARGKITGKSEDRKKIWQRIVETYPKSDWAKKVSFAFE